MPSLSKERYGRRQGMGSALFLVAASFATTPAAAAPRDWQPLILKGSQLQMLIGAGEKNFEVLSIHARKLASIPFQIDERSSDGGYVLPQARSPRGAHRGVLGPDDELVVMLSNLGDRATSKDNLPGNALEIEVSDPVENLDRFAYVAAVTVPLPAVPVTYGSIQSRIVLKRLAIEWGSAADGLTISRSKQNSTSTGLI